MKKNTYSGGFTLIEMLVVIVIIATLIAMIMPNISKVRERSWRAKCASNLRQLYHASINYATDTSHGNLPWPASAEGWDASRELEWNQTRTGWVDWLEYNPHKSGTDPSPIEGVMSYWWGEKGTKCIHKGVLWKYIKDDRIYICPTMQRRMKTDKGIPDSDPENYRDVRRCYIMNGEISKEGTDDVSIFDLSHDKEGMSRRMFFADAAYEAKHGATWGLKDDGDDDEDEHQWFRKWYRGRDGMLEYDYERIGDWHDGKANVIFLDGHVERISPDNTEKICKGEWGD